jgi:NitT/TauT family transport system substrate-binding protein
MLTPVAGTRSRARRAMVTGVGGVAAAALLAVSGCGSSDQASSSGGTGSTTAVTVAYVPLAQFEPLFVAMHDGYFTRRGIDVHLMAVTSGQSAIALAATNRVQVTLDGFSGGMFNAIHQGQQIEVVGSMAEEAPGAAANALVGAASLFKAGKAITPAALKRKRIAVDGGTGSTDAYLVAHALAPYHVSLDQVTLVDLDFPKMADALKTGAVAAAFMTSPFLAEAVSHGDGKIMATAPVGVATTGVIYGDQFAGTPAAQQLFDALVEASHDLQGMGAMAPANLAIVAKATGQSLSALEAEPPSEFSPDLAPPIYLLNDMQDVFLSTKELSYSTPIPASTYVDDAFSNNAG